FGELRSNRCRDTEDEARCARRPQAALLGAAYIPAADPRLPLPRHNRSRQKKGSPKAAEEWQITKCRLI
ncbi:MAG: hypothetical protein AB7F71_19195, partial [Burkholderiaceae bacterium]